MFELQAQCYPPLETRKSIIVKTQSPYLLAFQFEKRDIWKMEERIGRIRRIETDFFIKIHEF